MELVFRAIAEAKPGAKWRDHAHALLPAYRRWFLAQGSLSRPTYARAAAALRAHMPELLPTYERIVDLAGGGDVAARLLSLWCPTPYLAGCSQVAWTRGEPALVRNYDYNIALCEATVLSTQWRERRVFGMSDCLWGLLDGVNDRGLSVSLAFGGRKIVGAGFGIPLVLRYLLETCDTAGHAGRVLGRVPVNMAYNVTVVDAEGDYLTAYVAPDRPTAIRRRAIATNHQDRVEWPDHAKASRTVERAARLQEMVEDETVTLDHLMRALLAPPLFLRNYHAGWGTLYTALYRPAEGTAEYHWREHVWRKSFDSFAEEELRIQYAEPAANGRHAPSRRPEDC